jgi:glycosyltransferase involved in cell wall biosynthesis
MNRLPLVSVIIVFLNAEKFLEETVGSVLDQTYPNWELLLVDDGSTDRSSDIARGYLEQYSERIQYFEHENHQNRGTAIARNLGIHHAKGEYLAFLDADDVWLPHKLEHQVAILQAQVDAGMVYGPIWHWYSWSQQKEDEQRDHCEELGFLPNTLLNPPDLLINLIQKKYQQPIPSSMMLRRQTLDKVGYFEDSFPVRGEDYVFLIKVALEVSVFVSGEYLVKYRRYTNVHSVYFKKSRQRYALYLELLDWMKEYFRAKNVQNPKIWRVLNKMQFLYKYSLIYILWRRCLELAILNSHKFLPVKIRHWLWINIVSRFYGKKLKKNSQFLIN